ncbi:MAG: GerMN domain-containing protein [Chloroflexota bacterium]
MFRRTLLAMLGLALLTACTLSQLFPPPLATETAGPVQFYLIIPEDGGANGQPVGCGDSIIAVDGQTARTGNLTDDVRASLGELLSLTSPDYGQSGFVTSLHDSTLTVADVRLEGDTLYVEFDGSLQLLGVCADARMRAQLLATIFQYEGFDEAMITVSGDNLKQLFDASGMVGPDETFTRDEAQRL